MNPSTSQEQALSYHIDGCDLLCEVGKAWSQNALANEGVEVMPERVLGRSLWDFIEDDNVRELYRQMLHRVRSGYPAQFDYRCDAPEWRRQYRMTIREVADGTVQFLSQLIWKEPRPRVDMIDIRMPRSEEWVRVCSWCQNVSIPWDSWVPVEEAVERLGLLAVETWPRLTHGICPPCHSGMMEQLTSADVRSEEGVPAPSQPTELLPPYPEKTLFKQ